MFFQGAETCREDKTSCDTFGRTEKCKRCASEDKCLARKFNVPTADQCDSRQGCEEEISELQSARR